MRGCHGGFAQTVRYAAARRQMICSCTNSTRTGTREEIKISLSFRVFRASVDAGNVTEMHRIKVWRGDRGRGVRGARLVKPVLKYSEGCMAQSWCHNSNRFVHVQSLNTQGVYFYRLEIYVVIDGGNWLELCTGLWKRGDLVRNLRRLLTR